MAESYKEAQGTCNEIPWSTISDSAADIDAYRAMLSRSQPDDQIEEGRKWDERARKGIVSVPDKLN